VLVRHPLSSGVYADLARAYPPTAQELALILGDVLVQNDHEPTGSRTMSL